MSSHANEISMPGQDTRFQMTPSIENADSCRDCPRYHRSLSRDVMQAALVCKSQSATIASLGLGSRATKQCSVTSLFRRSRKVCPMSISIRRIDHEGVIKVQLGRSCNRL